MTPRPGDIAREQIDRMLEKAGWLVQDVGKANIHAGKGVALREFLLKTGCGFADYLLYVDGQAAGVVEAKKEGSTLTGVEIQSGKYKDFPTGFLPGAGRFRSAINPPARKRDSRTSLILVRAPEYLCLP